MESTQNPNSNRAMYGAQREDHCLICNSRHFQNSRQNRICVATAEMARELVSEVNIKQHAEDARQDAEHHMKRVAYLSDPTFRRAEAFKAYAKARAWEFGTDAEKILGSDVAQAFRLQAAGLL